MPQRSITGRLAFDPLVVAVPIVRQDAVRMIKAMARGSHAHFRWEPNCSDASLVANILARVGGPATHSQLATALNWHGARIDQAVTILREALAGARLRLQLSPKGMITAPSPDSPAEEAAAKIKSRIVEDDHRTLELIWKAWQGGRELSFAELTLARERMTSLASGVTESGQPVERDDEAYKDAWQTWRSGREPLRLSGLSDSELILARELVSSHLLEVNESGDLRLSRSIRRALAPTIAERGQNPVAY